MTTADEKEFMVFEIPFDTDYNKLINMINNDENTYNLKIAAYELLYKKMKLFNQYSIVLQLLESNTLSFKKLIKLKNKIYLKACSKIHYVKSFDKSNIDLLVQGIINNNVYNSISQYDQDLAADGIAKHIIATCDNKELLNKLLHKVYLDYNIISNETIKKKLENNIYYSRNGVAIVLMKYLENVDINTDCNKDSCVIQDDDNIKYVIHQYLDSKEYKELRESLNAASVPSFDSIALTELENQYSKTFFTNSSYNESSINMIHSLDFL